jgi:hypothetical protein
MLRNIFNYLGITLLILSTSQCLSKCQTGFVHDTTNLHLNWQGTSKPVDLAGLDLDKASGGKVCYVPTQKATYFIDLQGNTWKFTQQSDGSLQAQSISRLGTTFKPGEAFAFTAGTQEQQSLFVGKITDKVLGGKVQLWKCENDTWQAIPQPKTSITNLFPNTQDWKTAISSCNWQESGHIYGCVMVALQQKSGDFSIGILTFDPDTNQFTGLKKLLILGANRIPSVAISPAPGKILSQYTKAGEEDIFVIIDLANNQVEVVNKEIKNIHGYRVLGAFNLQLEGEFPILDPIFYALENEIYQFLRLDARNKLMPASNTSNIVLDKKTLILPFDKEVYCITTRNSEEGEAQTVYYQAKLEMNPNKPKPTPSPEP